MARRARLDLILNDVGASVAQQWQGGSGVFTAEGTFGGGSVALQMLTANGTWVPVNVEGTNTPISLTVAGMANFKAPATQLRAVPTTATAVFAYATGVPTNNGG
jgi:hypothetical protein